MNVIKFLGWCALLAGGHLKSVATYMPVSICIRKCKLTVMYNNVQQGRVSKEFFAASWPLITIYWYRESDLVYLLLAYPLRRVKFADPWPNVIDFLLADGYAQKTCD